MHMSQWLRFVYFAFLRNLNWGRRIFCLSLMEQLDSASQSPTLSHCYTRKANGPGRKEQVKDCMENDNILQCRILAKCEYDNYTFKPLQLLRYHLITSNGWLPTRYTPNVMMFLKLFFTESFLKCVQIALCQHGEPFQHFDSDFRGRLIN